VKVFVCHRNTDSDAASEVLKQLLEASSNTVCLLAESEDNQDWKRRVDYQLRDVDFVLFCLGKSTFASDAINWEYGRAKDLNKRIVAIRLAGSEKDDALTFRGFPIFDDAKQCWPYLRETCEADRQLLLQQYAMMVASTEKVTDQRLKVNNLFFTVTSSVLSISIVIGKAFELSALSVIGMLALTLIAFIITFFWESLVRSYGKLNTGKFIVIDEIEKQLRTNMFEHEWDILKKKLGYAPNTETEATVVKGLRWLIILVFLIEVVYLVSKCM
jgi:hypothetical protein